jgi:hypothetical protein
VVVQEDVPGVERTTYLLTLSPFSRVGALQATDSVRLPDVATTSLGELGTDVRLAATTAGVVALVVPPGPVVVKRNT